MATAKATLSRIAAALRGAADRHPKTWRRLVLWMTGLVLLGTIVGMSNFSGRSLFTTNSNNAEGSYYQLLGANLQPLPKEVSWPNKRKSKTNAKNDDIQVLALIGERNSGTTWMHKELLRCYNTTTLQVERELTRYKHQFQYYDPVEHASFPPTLVITEVRDPYQWMLGMISKPEYSHHYNMDWKQFVTSQWTIPRAPSDGKYADSTGRVCQYNYTYKEIVSCEENPEPDEYLTITHKSHPVHQKKVAYEMDPKTFQPYDSIIELRRDKILNHVEEIRNFPFVRDALVLRYEELLLRGTQFLHKEITLLTGVEPHCDMVPPQEQRKKRIFPPGFREWMDLHTDWTTEAKVGYTKLQDSGLSNLSAIERSQFRSASWMVVVLCMVLTLVVGMFATRRKCSTWDLQEGKDLEEREEMAALTLDHVS